MLPGVKHSDRSAMTARERLLAALAHRLPDRLPWAPPFLTWWTTRVPSDGDGVPTGEPVRDLPDFLQAGSSYYGEAARLGLDILTKGAGTCRAVLPNVEVSREPLPAGQIRTRYITPVGETCSVHTEAADYAHTMYKTTYEFSSMADYPVIRYMVENTSYEPAPEDYLAKQEMLGDSGLFMTGVPDSPLHRLFVEWMGYEQACFALHDYPREMDALLGLVREKNEEAVAVVVKSPAPVVLTGENTNSDFETPPLFRKYALPYLQYVSEQCHANDKLHVAHMCGKLKSLLPDIARAGLDGIESLTPPPYADTYLWEARAALPGVCIIGGVSPHMLVGEWTRPDFESYLRNLLARMAPGDNFILSVSDDTPTDAHLERFLWTTELVMSQGCLPLRA